MGSPQGFIVAIAEIGAQAVHPIAISHPGDPSGHRFSRREIPVPHPDTPTSRSASNAARGSRAQGAEPGPLRDCRVRGPIPLAHPGERVHAFHLLEPEERIPIGRFIRHRLTPSLARRRTRRRAPRRRSARPGRLPVARPCLADYRAVHHHEVDSGGRQGRRLVGRPVRDRLRVEHHEIGMGRRRALRRDPQARSGWPGGPSCDAPRPRG